SLGSTCVPTTPISGSRRPTNLGANPFGLKPRQRAIAMEALIYAMGALGALITVAGLTLLFRRVRARETELQVAGFGKIRTGHHGVALVFLGAVLFLQSASHAKQRGHLQATVEQLERSQQLIVAGLTPSLIADQAFVGYFRGAPSSQQAA